MKRLIASLALLTALLAITATAGDTNTYKYISTYRFIEGTNTDVGTTGISTGTSYACFPVSELYYTSDANARTNGDIRALSLGVIKMLYETISNYNPTNGNLKPTYFTIEQSSRYSSATNAEVIMKYETQNTLSFSKTGAITIPAE